MNDIISSLVACLLMLAGFRVMRRRYEPSERRLLLLALCGHLLSGFILTPLTRDVLGGGDMFVYYQVGSHLLERFRQLPLDTLNVLWGLIIHAGNPLPIPDQGLPMASTGSMLAFSTIVLFFTGSSLYGACVTFAGFSFFAQARIYDVFRAELPSSVRLRVLAATMLVPSEIFWVSGVIKEALAVIGLGLLFKELHAFYRRRFSLSGLLVAAAGLFLVLTIKGYLVLPLGVSCVATVLFGRDRQRRVSRFRRFGAAALGVAVVLTAGILSSRYDVSNVQEETVHLAAVGGSGHGGSAYSIVKDRSLGGQVAAVPAALVTALFRPAISEAKNAQMAANGLETLLLTVLTLGVLARGGLLANYRIVKAEPILLFSVVFSVIVAVGVGLASTNLGTLSRYRTPMSPFLWGLVVVLRNGRTMLVREKSMRSLSSLNQPALEPHS